MRETRHIHSMSEEYTSTSPNTQFLSAPSPTTPEQIQQRIPLHWIMLGIALLAQITVSIVTQGVPILAPFLQADLGLTQRRNR
jgi:hypothetical protein